MNELRLVYNNTCILCVPVCLSTLRYPEQEVVSPRFLHYSEEVHLASCTTCFSSLYDVRFERKSLWKLFASYASNSVHAPLHFQLPWAGWILPTTTKLLEHFSRVHIERHALHITANQVTQGWMSLACYSNYAGTFSKVTREGHVLHITGTIAAIAFYVHGL